MATEQIDLFLATFYMRIMELAVRDMHYSKPMVNDELNRAYIEVFALEAPKELMLNVIDHNLSPNSLLKELRDNIDRLTPTEKVPTQQKTIKQSLSTLISYQKELDDTF